MRLDQPIDVMGKFWLPEHSEEDGVIGRLIIEDGGNIRLELYHNIDADSLFADLFPRDLEYIHGQLENSRFVTLRNCMYVSTVNDNENNCETKFLPLFAFLGSLFGKESPISFDKYVFQMIGLNDWLYKYNLIDNKREYGKQYTIQLGSHNGADIEIITYFELNDNAKTSKPTQHSFITIKTKQPQDWQFFRRFTYNLGLFFSVVCNRKASAYNIVGKNKNHLNALNIYYVTPSTSNDKVTYPRQKLLFVYSNVEKTIVTRLQKWFKICDDIGYAIDLFISNKETKYDKLASKFLKLMQAFEVLANYTLKTDKALQKEKDAQKSELDALKKRLLPFLNAKEQDLLSSKLGNVMGLPPKYILTKLLYGTTREWQNEEALETFLRVIFRIRNIYTHGHTISKLKNSSDFVNLMIKLECCFRLVIFNKIGFEKEELYGLVERSGWFKQKLDFNFDIKKLK
ncbi:HEPN domain-containing protein [Bartonella sp. HY761]|uniref:ApeA N-terminal domain 1-containing protein n=1 Tax=Bartonella sp. HY761 TaxID=2979330 RepID=UPI0021E2FD5B|nr:HEPN domain-containing protein [Bartonella sp. HY761]UXN08063.1 hypothetical protein N6A79_14910 [Bartonella sp. HY761]